MKRPFSSLRFKILVPVCLALLIAIIVLYFAISQITYSEFEAIERDEQLKNAERVLERINTDNRQMIGMVEEYAIWDATYDYARGNNPEYLTKDVTLDVLPRQDLDKYIIINKEREFTLYMFIDNQTISLSPNISETSQIKNNDIFFVHEYTNQTVYGIILLKTGPVMFAASPILTSDRTSEIAGTMIMIRNIDDEYTSRISAQIKRNVNIEAYKEAHIEELRLEDSKLKTMKTTTQHIIEGEKTHIHDYYFRILNDTQTIIYTTMQDTTENPALFISITADRDVHAQAKKTVGVFLLSTIIIGVLLMIVLTFMIYYQILKRIFKINKEIFNLTSEKSHPKKIYLSGNDELSSVVEALNDALSQLDFAMREKESIFRAYPDTIITIDDLGKITTQKLSASLSRRAEISEYNSSNESNNQLFSPSETSTDETPLKKEVNDYFSKENVTSLVASSLKAITDNSNSTIEFQEDEYNTKCYYEANIYPSGNKSAIVLIKDVSEINRRSEFLKMRNEEAEKFNKLSVDRELKMMDLKKENDELKDKMAKMLKRTDESDENSP